jgi:transposase InsO family protein
VKFEFIRAEKVHYPVAVLCDVLEVSRSGYYAWRDRPPSARATRHAALSVSVKAVHARSRGVYGSPRVHAELQAQGTVVSQKTVAKAMKAEGIRGRRKRRFKNTTNSNHGQPVSPNLLKRDFTADAPNKVWVTDVTAIDTWEGCLYLAVILDLFSRRAVAWATSASNDTALALDALQQAVSLRKPPPGLVHHSDRGSPYASEDYRAALRASGIIQSMSRKGNCLDNAVAESFFATLRAELLDHESYPTHAAARRSLSQYIDPFYNLERRHSFLGYINPIESELRFTIRREAA